MKHRLIGVTRLRGKYLAKLKQVVFFLTQLN